MPNMVFFRPLDALVLVLVAACALAAITSVERQAGRVSEILVDNQVRARFDLNGPVRQKNIPTRIGDVRIRVGQGQIRVLQSPCQKQICVAQGPISHVRQSIVCVPAGLLIRVVSTDSAADKGHLIDALSY